MDNIVTSEFDSNRRIRILICAFACLPNRGSEPGIGWNVAVNLGKFHDVTVICGDLDANGEMLRGLGEFIRGEKTSPEGVHFKYVPPSLLIRGLRRLSRIPGMWPLYFLSYRFWQKRAYFLAKKLHGQEPYDIVHMLTFGTFREPGYLWKLDAPFFWGPFGGAAMIPESFFTMFPRRTRMKIRSRNFLNRLQILMCGRSKRAARKAQVIWAATPEDAEMTIKRWGVRAEFCPDVGLDFDRQGSCRTKSAEAPLKLVWCGIVEGRKALPLLIRAISRLPPSFPWELHVVGSGEELDLSKSLGSAMGLSSIVWHGRIGNEDAKEIIRSCHVLVHTSLKEGTPTVIMEALAYGLPVICHDCCGMGAVVDDSCGIKIPVRDAEASIIGFASAIVEMGDPTTLSALSKGALERAPRFSWREKVAMYGRCYSRVLSAASCKEKVHSS